MSVKMTKYLKYFIIPSAKEVFFLSVYFCLLAGLHKILVSLYPFVVDPNKNPDQAYLKMFGFFFILDKALLNSRGLLGLGGGMRSTKCHWKHKAANSIM